MKRKELVNLLDDTIKILANYSEVQVRIPETNELKATISRREVAALCVGIKGVRDLLDDGDDVSATPFKLSTAFIDFLTHMYLLHEPEAEGSDD